MAVAPEARPALNRETPAKPERLDERRFVHAAAVIEDRDFDRIGLIACRRESDPDAPRAAWSALSMSSEIALFVPCSRSHAWPE